MSDQIKEQPKTIYRVQGFSCASCAKQFEENVKQLNGVQDAQVNFGAAKLTVSGETTIAAIEKAGAFENLTIVPEHETVIRQSSAVEMLKENWNIIVSGLFLLVGWFSYFSIGEKHSLTIFLFATSILIGGYQLFLSGFKNLSRLQFDMRTLMTIAILGAAIIGEWGEGATVVILFAISEALESHSMDRARRSIRSLMDIAPKTAFIHRNGTEMVIPVEEIAIGDRMIVKPGEKLAMDGIVVRGNSTINEAAITGESIPVTKTKDDEVFAGTLNESGLLEVKVTKHVHDTTIAKIIHLVEEAQAKRAPSQAFVDTFAKYYTPAIIFVAFLVAIIPPVFWEASWDKWIYQGLAVLVVGCPCALVISTPVSIVTAIGNAARQGVLIKGGIHLEELGRVRAIAFDKTGTLTKGVPTVTGVTVVANHVTEADVLQVAAALEKGSQHPLAHAIISRAEADSAEFRALQVEQFTSLTGKGIKGTVEGTPYYIGNPKLFNDLDATYMTKTIQKEVKRYQEEGQTTVLIANDTKVLAIIAIADEIRDTSSQVIQRLRKLGMKEIIMLTGDNRGTAMAIGKQIGIHQTKAELLPEDKLSYMNKLQKKHQKVAMVGDGINDAPALAAATVGVAMGGAGTDTALETADVALMGDDLRKLPFTIRLSRKALRIIKQNITFSLAIKLFALLLVVPGWLTLWIAIFADMGATLLVTFNGLRLLNVKPTNAGD